MFRHEEDGVQDAAVAREVLRVLHVQEPHRHKVVHPQGARHLLRQVLRGQVRHKVHQVQEGQSVTCRIYTCFLVCLQLFAGGKCDLAVYTVNFV